ncbi:hypothetical protein SDRG_15629 [Saprolegnia diclina VS20]|uniref:Uncharacterized protein n=1 Tax=Saprolegnia diclina (strain VS20) TaxID=1156394 RepID=T0RAI1_SAPDV|nr:hypothetical protein SDRG_15629 [Saprolegnia diclina VS20]EQC26537.1 hypothetical protein SDRG_15629 [Saprolegnia diclina VS20]|eukprot:XP_008620030.1 hypothetical protein SDRG_15629 [Saprolegnia diclina VS20]
MPTLFSGYGTSLPPLPVASRRPDNAAKCRHHHLGLLTCVALAGLGCLYFMAHSPTAPSAVRLEASTPVDVLNEKVAALRRDEAIARFQAQVASANFATSVTDAFDKLLTCLAIGYKQLGEMQHPVDYNWTQGLTQLQANCARTPATAPPVVLVPPSVPGSNASTLPRLTRTAILGFVVQQKVTAIAEATAANASMVLVDATAAFFEKLWNCTNTTIAQLPPTATLGIDDVQAIAYVVQTTCMTTSPSVSMTPTPAPVTLRPTPTATTEPVPTTMASLSLSPTPTSTILTDAPPVDVSTAPVLVTATPTPTLDDATMVPSPTTSTPTFGRPCPTSIPTTLLIEATCTPDWNLDGSAPTFVIQHVLPQDTFKQIACPGVLTVAQVLFASFGNPTMASGLESGSLNNDVEAALQQRLIAGYGGDTASTERRYYALLTRKRVHGACLAAALATLHGPHNESQAADAAAIAQRCVERASSL